MGGDRGGGGGWELKTQPIHLDTPALTKLQNYFQAFYWYSFPPCYKPW